MNQKKKIAMIIASQEFRDEECFETKDILKKQGFEITLFSNKKGIAKGRFGGEIEVEKTLEELNPSDFDCILFVGGAGAMKYLDNELSYDIVKRGNDENKILAAICISPLILARAGVLKGKEATVWSDSLDKSAVKEIMNKGVKYVPNKSVISNNIVTASDVSAIKEFCKNIAKKMNSISDTE